MTDYNLLVLDFETYYGDDYTLKGMPTPNYILDDRYETIMCAVALNGQPPGIVDGPDVPAFLKELNPQTTITVAHNALFDNSILAWRYNFIPLMMLDTMGMFRALYGHLCPGASLDTMSAFFKLPPKLKTLAQMKNKRRADIMTEGLWPDFCAYAKTDVSNCREAFKLMYRDFPTGERKVMDLVLRCAVEPKFVVNQELFTQHLVELRQHKANLLDLCGVTVDDLMSTDRFKLALESRGVEIAYKTSPTGRTIPAFARTDEFMTELQEHDDPVVQALAAARLGHKSTIEETRTEKLLSIAQLPWQNTNSRGTLPAPLAYGRAHTHRLAGEWGMNMQNLPTARGSKGKSKIRQGLEAPKDHVVVVGDLGQIEARLTAYLCGAEALTKQFRDKLDPYAILAGGIFGRPIDRKVQIAEGFIGKTGVLGLQYGCGANKFYNMVKMQARGAGLDLGSLWTAEVAIQAVDTYRYMYDEIPATWRYLDGVLRSAWMGNNVMSFGPCSITYGRVVGPGGLTMNYASPRRDLESGELLYTYGKETHKIYGAKFLENIIQFLARVVLFNAAVRLADLGYVFSLQVHDELVFIVRENILDIAMETIRRELTRPPTWAPDLPLIADVNFGKSYGEAK